MEPLDLIACWKRTDGPGFEVLSLVSERDRIVAHSVVVGIADGEPFRFRYRIVCDDRWQIREAHLEDLGRDEAVLSLSSDGRGSWFSGMGSSLIAISRCLDLDISVTPFTNTLPVRRLDLAEGESRTFRVAYFAVPAFQLRPVEQRYTCLQRSAAGGRYRYESLTSGHATEIGVDRDGLVVEYPGRFRRVEWPGG